MGRKDEINYELYSMNQLRTVLYEMGVKYPDNANRDELVRLIKENQ